MQAGVVIRYGSKPRQVPSHLPTDRVTLYGDVSITADRLILLAIGCVSAFLLWLLYRSSQFGIQTEAVSESERSAAAVGVSPNKVAALNWALGSAIACIAGILVVPVITLQVTSMTSLVLAALAAALVGDFKSFPIATAAGYVLGMSQTLVGRFWDQQGLDQSLPFLLIILMLVFRGRSIPLRDHYLRKLPAIGNGRISWDWTIFLAGVVVFLMLTKDTKWIDALTVTLCASIVLLSIVVVTGYAGQLSLAQYAMAGFGAWVAGRLVAVFHIPFLLALVAGVAAAVPLGLIFALPAVRTRGINLAIVTLGLGTAIELMLFSNGDFTGGIKGTPVGNPSLFGFEISSIRHPERYGIFVLGMALLTVLVVANVRRGRSGRRLIAVRTNERAAAALGINIVTAKLYAFALASAIAALGGILMAFRLTSISYQSFTNFTSITYAGLSLVGRRRPSARSVRRGDDGDRRLQPGGHGVHLGRGRPIHPADQRNRDPPGRALQPGRRRRRVGQDLPAPEAHEEVRRVVLHQALRRVRTRRRRPRPACDPQDPGRRGPHRAVRRGHRRRPGRVHARTGPGHRPDRPQRRRQDVVDRRPHRRSPGRAARSRSTAATSRAWGRRVG